MEEVRERMNPDSPYIYGSNASSLYNTVVTSSSSLSPFYVTTASSANFTVGAGGGGGSSGGYHQDGKYYADRLYAPPKPSGPLSWLDAEIDGPCQAGRDALAAV